MRQIIRARQRSRTALPAFTPALAPLFRQTGIDRVQIALRGTWRITGAGDRATSAAEYKELLTSAPINGNWFLAPQNNPRYVILETRAAPSSTLSKVRINVAGWPSNGGDIRCEVVANPTRTLAHLLAEYGDEPDFMATIEALPIWSFFARAETPINPAFGRNDNWIEDYDQARRCLGEDVFTAFLPTFVRKLNNLIVSLVTPRDSTSITSDGAELIMAEPGIEVRLGCGRTNVPQIECYFERHHAEAVAGVRAAVAAALVTLNRATVARYEQFTSHWMEREDDCLSIATDLANNRRLVIYAKSKRRIRFEVKRLKKGDYIGLAAPVAPDDRLLAIFAMERANLLTASRWASVGRLFDEPGKPSIADLSRLCGLVAAACIVEGEDVQSALTRLLEDGGLGRDGSGQFSAELVERLRAYGVLERTRLQQKDVPALKQRLGLRPEFRAVIDSVASALISEDREGTSARADGDANPAAIQR